MTKLPQTIEVLTHSITGLNCKDVSFDEGRCTGKTTAIALEAIGRVMRLATPSSSGHTIIYDHDTYLNCLSRGAATHLLETVAQLIELLGFRGFKLELHQSTELRHIGRSVWGVKVTFSQTTVAVYDLRK